MLAKKEEAEPEQKAEDLVPWSEPESLQALQDQYIIETKFTGRAAGTTLVLCQSKRRDGSQDQCLPNQKYKLFLVTLQQWSNLLISVDSCLGGVELFRIDVNGGPL